MTDFFMNSSSQAWDEAISHFETARAVFMRCRVSPAPLDVLQYVTDSAADVLGFVFDSGKRPDVPDSWLVPGVVGGVAAIASLKVKSLWDADLPPNWALRTTATTRSYLELIDYIQASYKEV